MTTQLTNQVIALAGLCQATALVHTLAQTGRVDAETLRISTESIFKIDAERVEDIYGGLSGIVEGLNTLIEQLQRRTHFDITRYIVTLLHLERKLARNPQLINNLRADIEQAHEQAKFFHSCHENVFSRLADVYSRNISPLKPKVIVTGERSNLQDNRLANQIRTLLLAGLRSAVLWRQVGGKRWHMVIYGRRILAEAERLLQRARQ